MKCTDDSYWKNVAEIEGEPHYQLGLLVFSVLLLCETAFYMSRGLGYGSAVLRAPSLVLLWDAENLAFMLNETTSPPAKNLPSPKLVNETEPGVDQLKGERGWGHSCESYS